MAGLDEMKEQLKDQLSSTWARIQESTLFNNLRERYETLPGNAQKGLLIGGVVFAILMLLYFPYSFLDSASVYMTEFEEKRAVIRQLLRVSRQSQAQTPIPQGPSLPEVAQDADTIFADASLMDDQKGAVQAISLKSNLGFIPPTIQQQAFSVEAKKLNLRQIVDIGFKLGQANPALKMVGVDVRAAIGAPAAGYFDVIYKLVSYNFPQGGADLGGEGAAPRGRPTPPPRQQMQDAPNDLPPEEMPMDEAEETE